MELSSSQKLTFKWILESVFVEFLTVQSALLQENRVSFFRFLISTKILRSVFLTKNKISTISKQSTQALNNFQQWIQSDSLHSSICILLFHLKKYWFFCFPVGCLTEKLKVNSYANNKNLIEDSNGSSNNLTKTCLFFVVQWKWYHFRNGCIDIVFTANIQNGPWEICTEASIGEREKFNRINSIVRHCNRCDVLREIIKAKCIVRLASSVITCTICYLFHLTSVTFGGDCCAAAQ